MPCYRPVTVWKPLDGGPVSFRELKDHREIEIPCSKCIGCRIQRQEAWAFRCYAESKMHSRNCFITLTYDDEHLPNDCSLNHREWQLFAKKLRQKAGPFRFFMCGEYGDNTGRPHYHALLFGFDFDDKRKCNSVYSSHDLYESELLSEVWGKGFCSIGEVTYASARYVSAYTCKSVSGDSADRYSLVDPYTGEITVRESPYGRMSLRPGLGASWFEKYWPEVYAHGGVHVAQKKQKIPLFFDELFAKLHPEEFDDSKFSRSKEAEKFIDNNTVGRLATREKCVIAKRKFNKERYSHAL